jgi:phage I-like protein
MKTKTLNLAVLSFEVTATGNTIQLLPAGRFRANDGRPFDVKDGWFINAAIAKTLIQQALSKKNRLVIDYEHQTLRAAQNGQPAPAAGWFQQMEWRENNEDSDNDGLFAIDVEWTPKALEMLKNKEYRYISAVFLYDKQGRVNVILHAALTNTPAIDNMDEVLLAAASYMAGLSAEFPTTEANKTMDELIERLRWFFNLPALSTEEEVRVELEKMISMMTENTAAASFNALEVLSQQQQSIASLSSQSVDLTKYAPIGAVAALTSENVQLKEEIAKRDKEKVDDLIEAALNDGRLPDKLEGWAREVGEQNVAFLTSYLDNAKPIAALTTQQTQGNPPKGTTNQPTTHGLNEDATAICSLFGNDPAEIAQMMGIK